MRSTIRGVLVLIVLGSVGTAACSGGAEGSAVGSTTPEASTTQPPTTTTTTTAEDPAAAPLPSDPFGAPGEAVGHLHEAWRRGDRDGAGRAASPQVVEQLFAITWTEPGFAGSECTAGQGGHRCPLDGDGQSLVFAVVADERRGFVVTALELVDHDGTGEDAEAAQPEVLAMQQQLERLGFWLGEPDGEDGALTGQAVMAFQKANGLTPDGVAGPATRAALGSASRPLPSSTEDGIEIHLDRQLLYVVAGGEVRWVLNTSTGASSTPTPAGSFAVERRVDGVRRAPLGDLYRPAYFHGGVAIHGSPSIPAYPASHGCARISDPAMDMLWASSLVELGTAVRVV